VPLALLVEEAVVEVLLLLLEVPAQFHAALLHPDLEDAAEGVHQLGLVLVELWLVGVVRG
jgi:hypothetical protein